MAPSLEIIASAQPDPEFLEACALPHHQNPPPLPANVDIPTLRATSNKHKNEARDALGGTPPSLTERDIEIPVRDGSSILAYVYAPSDVVPGDELPIFLFFHGGGFCLGTRHDDMESNRILAVKAGIIIVCLDYRLAPEHPFPQAIHDGVDALNWIAENPTKVHPSAAPSAGLIIGGTSAGASIANGVVYLNRDLGSPAKVSGQFLGVGPLLPPPSVPEKYKDDYVSHEQNKDVTIPPEELARAFVAAYKPDPTSPIAVPAVHSSGHSGIPPTYFQVCGLDGLRDESIIYEQILQENSISTRLDLYPDSFTVNLSIESQIIVKMAVTNRRKSRDSGDVEARPSSEPSGPHYRRYSQPFAGRLGANQAYVVEGGTSEDDHVLHHAPDATPHMSFRELMDMRPIKNLDLWKAALIEGIGTLLFVYITIWVSISPDTAPAAPTQRFGSFDNAAFLGPLIGGITNLIFITLFITSFGAISGAHFNPLITFATFCARLCSLPRLILYVAAQIGGGALAGLLVRASWGGRGFKVGGCWLFTDIVPPREIFVVELVSATLLLFLAFGVGLDPRQAKIIGPALGPFMVGLSVGTMSFASAFARYGYGGAGMNPARCMGAFVGSRFPSWHWIHWVADGTACIIHGFCYYFIPPWTEVRQ
ncbi:sterigmatocystin biosynthesis lipase esterase STCI [Fusarium subglutinans]|uniref:Sterigmatocystin biosynthesis lipase esterase STCI n=1 Tax=Gibberella subglutinans TaxID=42677 RepID=A0A8H5PTI0_GIBSU|nr:sterigmatocystin biosynthesis lipase esterase STCI [Fusarium subglutinans]KAF5602182.1 sterigmatocystin biosynthesis lipase esterase STCI [Fusarium subglutinans]